MLVWTLSILVGKTNHAQNNMVPSEVGHSKGSTWYYWSQDHTKPERLEKHHAGGDN